MVRYKVIRKSIRWNRQTYHTGDLLPETFSEKDKYRVLYPSRITSVEVKEEVKTTPIVSMGTKAAEKPVAPAKPTGAISGAIKVAAKVK